MTPLPRDICPTCGREVALRRRGELREHRNEFGELCVASGLTIKQVEQRIDQEVAALRRMSQ